MKVSINTGTGVPQAQICINKSRLKVYNKDTNPTYYLQKGQEFQIELFNPTSNSVLAEIELNGNKISHGGLILRPGERIFLERYIDVAKKFMFDTYEVSNTEEVRKAIEDNGDFKVQFYRESKPNYFYGYGYNTTCINIPCTYTTTLGGSNTAYYNSTVAGSIDITTSNSASNTLNLTNISSTCSNTTNDRFKKENRRSVETGRVEKGSESNQKLEYVDKTFDLYAFHIIKYKLLPISQKINTAADVHIKQYCTNCGSKQKPEWKFCPSCGKKC
jgi:hypothetical protein